MTIGGTEPLGRSSGGRGDLACSSLPHIRAKHFGRLLNTHYNGDHVDGDQFFTYAESLGHPYWQKEVLSNLMILARRPEWRMLQRNANLCAFIDDLVYFILDSEKGGEV